MKLSLITDECTHDPFTAFELGRKWGIEDYEIRYAYRWRVPEGPGWASDLVAAAVKAYGVKVSAISPGLFKPVMRADGSKVPVSIDAPAEIRRHIDELLPRFLDFGARLNAHRMIVFALPKPAQAPGAIPAVVIDSLGEAAQKAADASVTLLLENGQGSWADTGAASRAIVEAVGSPALRLTWDPANVVHGGFAEDPVKEGYPLVREFIGNVHVKDAVCRAGKGQWVMLGEGQVDWRGQIAALRADGYDGYLTLEPHLQYESPVGLVGKTETFVAKVRGLMGG
jgi:sugar phosphate isomerase/epimerase